MKKNKLSIGITFLFAAIVCTYCTKEENSMVADSELSSIKKAKVSGYIPGTDITEQLQSDLESGLSVTLPAGHFYLRKGVWIAGYPGGTIKGAGRDLTIIETAEDFIPPYDPNLGGCYQSGVLTFQNTEGDIIIKSMSFLVKGEHPAERHWYPFLGGYWSTSIDNVITVAGSGASLECKDLRIKGEFVGYDVDGAFNGYNITWPIVGSGWGNEDLFDNLSVKDCEIDGAGVAAIDIWMGRTGEFKDNKISNAVNGIMLITVTEAITIKDCHFENITFQTISKTDIGGDCLCCFKDNTMDGQPMEDDCK